MCTGNTRQTVFVELVYPKGQRLPEPVLAYWTSKERVKKAVVNAIQRVRRIWDIKNRVSQVDKWAVEERSDAAEKKLHKLGRSCIHMHRKKAQNILPVFYHNLLDLGLDERASFIRSHS
ncbi:hypothetical protein RhiJN_11046 [Ceratobasidium sp. AG-Ba]|nr:hypothetical protein RhiJN_11046 [Ceratobasidium sp. AG-Ba]